MNLLLWLQDRLRDGFEWAELICVIVAGGVARVMKHSFDMKWRQNTTSDCGVLRG